MNIENIRHIVIIGATSTIAERCARIWVENHAAKITLVARDSKKVDNIKKDLEVRNSAARISAITCDFLDTSEIRNVVDSIGEADDIDIVLVAQGCLHDQFQCQNDLEVCRDSLNINAISPVLFAEMFLRHFERLDSGKLAIIGSVAGDRGRKSNYIYGAAKGLIGTYIQGAQHRTFGSKVKIIHLKPGPTDTAMTSHLKETGIKMATVDSVARDIVRAIHKGKDVCYTPPKWKLIMLIVRFLPGFIFNRTDM